MGCYKVLFNENKSKIVNQTNYNVLNVRAQNKVFISETTMDDSGHCSQEGWKVHFGARGHEFDSIGSQRDFS